MLGMVGPIRAMVGIRSVYVDIHPWGKLGDIRDGSIGYERFYMGFGLI